MSTGETTYTSINVTNVFENQKLCFEKHKMDWMSMVSPTVSDIKKFHEDDGQFHHYISIMKPIAKEIQEIQNQKKKSPNKSPNKKSTSNSKNIDTPEVNQLLALNKTLLEQLADLGIKFVTASEYMEEFHDVLEKFHDVIEKALPLEKENETPSQHKEIGDIIQKIQRLGKLTEEGYEKFNAMLKDTKKLLDESENNVINSQALEQQLKSDIKILSDVAANSNSSPTFHYEANLETVGRAVKEEMDYKRRKCNIMIFGYPNINNNTDLYQEIKTLFHHIVAMPIDFKVLAIIGNNIIKVKLADEWQVRYLLQNAKKLKDTEYKKTFITPDRSPEDREKRRALVKELNEKIAQYPAQRWFIKNGKVERAEYSSDTIQYNLRSRNKN